MKIEQEPLQLQALQMQPSATGGTVTLQSGKSFHLNALQFSYLDVLKNGMSIEAMVEFFLRQGWLVSFRELYNLFRFLIVEDILLNDSIKKYFKALEPQSEDGLNRLWKSLSGQSSVTTVESLPLTDLPFFRTLPKSTAEYLLQSTETLQVPKGIRILKAGATDRDLFLLLKGQVAIYKVLSPGQRQMVMSLENGALFGERGFLLAQTRSADVVTTQDSEILRIRHLPQFDDFIRNDKAQALQHRFWAMQALLSSTFFKDIPTDSLDHLIFTGKLCQVPAYRRLFAEGDPGSTCYILIQGSVVISKNNQTINVLNQGSCFGEISLLMSGGKRTATVLTQRDCILLEIQQSAFYKILSRNLVFAKELETLAAQRLQKDAQRTN